MPHAFSPRLDNALLSHPDEITFHYLTGQAGQVIKITQKNGKGQENQLIIDYLLLIIGIEILHYVQNDPLL